MEFLAQQYSDQVNMLHAAMRKLRDDVAQEHRARFGMLPHIMFFAYFAFQRLNFFMAEKQRKWSVLLSPKWRFKPRHSKTDF